MKNLKLLLLLSMIIVSASCTKDALLDTSGALTDESNSLKSSQAKLKIAVVSDIHYFDPTLMPADPENDPYFQGYLAKDPKLIHLSDPIFRQVIAELKIEKPDIVLIPGDLTKDGELLSHQSVAELLDELADANMKVFVVPGNHDINNPEALDFSVSPPEPTTKITAEDFASIYGNFGYDDAFSRDANSLSYINAVNDKLWILGIDACKYYKNEEEGIAVVDGAIKPETMAWIQEKMAEANANGITVLAMMHHGILQHYYGQEQLDPGYLVENWPEMAGAFMQAGIKLVFTGHYHANDISQIAVGKNTLSDVETGSLVSAPSPYRIMTLDDNFIKIESKRITKIGYPFPAEVNFVNYSNMFLTEHLDGYFNVALQMGYGIPAEQAAFIAPFLRNGVMAHYAGDEKIKPDERKNIDLLSLVVPADKSFLINAINSFWTDLPTTDNKAHIKLK
jgi:predicted MPP superfamily phosphohydrolase